MNAKRTFKTILLICGCLLLLFVSSACEERAAVSPEVTTPLDAPYEILWDTWGVPHIFADTEEDLFFAFGWAQMRNHGNTILELYGQSRGRAAELWGEEYLMSDQYMWTMGIPQRAEKEAENAELQDAFAQGINAYANYYPDELDDRLEAVLPITGQDVVAHSLFAIYAFYAQAGELAAFRDDYVAGKEVFDPRLTSSTSNAWAIGPSKSMSGNPILLANPHIFWPNMEGYKFVIPTEVHLVGPDLDFYGISFIGSMFPSLGFNNNLGWSFTHTPFDYVDYYELTLAEGGYLFDDAVKAFESETYTLMVKEEDGTLREEPLEVQRSIHGPVIAMKKDTAVALQIPPPKFGDDIQPMEMARAQNLDEFLAALELGQMTPLNYLYADRDDNIMYSLVGMFPDRPEGNYDWDGLVPGDTSDTLWNGILPYSDLFQVLNPDTGYLQNANEPPWTVTLPNTFEPADYPADWPAPTLTPRSGISLELINARDVFSVEDVMVDKFSTYSFVADRVVDDLVQAGKASDDSSVQEAVAVLENWDRTFDPVSPGSVLFIFWAMGLEPEILGPGVFPDDTFAVPPDPMNPFETPMGLADPDGAIEGLKFASMAVSGMFGSMEASWGDFVQFQIGEYSAPGFGQGFGPYGIGTFTPNIAMPQADGALQTVYGDTWVSVIEFSDPIKAMAIMPYGNATQPDSPYRGNQLPMYGEKQFRPVWLTREEIESNLDKVEYPDL